MAAITKKHQQFYLVYSAANGYLLSLERDQWHHGSSQRTENVLSVATFVH